MIWMSLVAGRIDGQLWTGCAQQLLSRVRNNIPCLFLQNEKKVHEPFDTKFQVILGDRCKNTLLLDEGSRLKIADHSATVARLKFGIRPPTLRGGTPPGARTTFLSQYSYSTRLRLPLFFFKEKSTSRLVAQLPH